MSLGADRTRVLRMILRDGMVLVAFGLLFGLGGSLALSNALSALLFGVTPRDPLTLLGVALAITAVGVLACYLPARRAATVDPIAVLRGE